MKNLKRRLALSMAFVMLLPLALTAFAAGEDAGFSDVPSDAWYAEAIAYCQEQGWMSGTSATEFSPAGETTRAVLAAVLYRKAGSPAVAGEDSFTDTESGKWYSPAVLWASQQGLITGYGNDVFGTNDPVSREQLVTILWRQEGSPDSQAGAAFADNGLIASWALQAVAWAKENNVISGRDGNRFDPKANANRAEVAAVLSNAAKTIWAEPEPAPAPAPADGNKVLIAYFSATNNTEGVANHIKATLGEGADLYEIAPETPYTAADLNYGNSSCRANREQNDDSARPVISGSVENMEQYDVIFLGYPIWWGTAPKIVHTFLESYDFGGKTIIPFCTSASSGYSDGAIRPLAPDALWQTGRRFSGGASQSTVKSWIDSLNLELALQ